MLTGEIKNKVDKIWETFWTGGITNPLTVIEQFTYLIFIKLLDDKQLQSEAEANILGVEPKIIFDKEYENLRWHNFKEFDAERMYDTVANKVFPFIKKLNGDSSSSFAKYKEIDVFGGTVFIDIDGKNIGQLGIDDFIIELTEGKHKIKMYKSHTYDTYIGFAETEIDVKDNEKLLIRYAVPMLVNQPGNIIVSNYTSQQDIQEIAQNRENKIMADHIADQGKKQN